MWLSAAEFRSRFNIAGGRYETHLQSASESAALIIQRGVDSEVYAEATASDPPADADELLRYKSVLEAHANLTMWFLIGNVGNRLGEEGFLKQAQAATSPGIGSTSTNTFLTPDELSAMRDQYLEQAGMWIEPYGTIEVTASVGEAETGLDIASLQWF